MLSNKPQGFKFTLDNTDEKICEALSTLDMIDLKRKYPNFDMLFKMEYKKGYN